jgi:hypothetical protein
MSKVILSLGFLILNNWLVDADLLPSLCLLYEDFLESISADFEQLLPILVAT